MIDKEKHDFIDHVVHLALAEEDRLLNEHGEDYSGLEEDGIDSNEYYRIITERVITILKENNNYMQEEPVSDTQTPVVFYGLSGSVNKPKEESVSEDNMIEWNTDKPQGDVIVVKVEEGFCDKKDCYEVLHFASKPYPHYYDAWCEEVPFSAIEKWALIK